MKIIAKRHILYFSKQYAPGDELNINDPEYIKLLKSTDSVYEDPEIDPEIETETETEPGTEAVAGEVPEAETDEKEPEKNLDTKDTKTDKKAGKKENSFRV